MKVLETIQPGSFADGISASRYVGA